MYVETMNKLFINAYLECALWSSLNNDDEPLDSIYILNDLAPETRQLMESEALSFFSANIGLLNETPEDYSYEHAGHDFWLTRNGRGSGFWDGDAGEVGNQLTTITANYPEQYLYVGEDNKLYIMQGA